jgi:hypothetical protein
MHRPSRRESITYCLDDPLILFRLHIVGLRVVHMVGFDHMARAHMAGFEHTARVHMAPVQIERVALTHMAAARMVATVPGRR